MAKKKKEMTLAKRLDYLVAEAEYEGAFGSFEDLCEALSNTRWATEQGYDEVAIGNLLYEHNIETETPKPPRSEWQSGETVEEEKPKKRPAPKHKPEPKPKPKPEPPLPLTTEKPKKVAPEPPPETKKKVTLSVASTTPESQRQRCPDARTVRITTPAGPCPVQLKGTSAEEVERWAEAVRKAGLEEHGKWYMIRALRYWVRQFYEINTPNHKLVCDTLDAIYISEAA